MKTTTKTTRTTTSIETTTNARRTTTTAANRRETTYVTGRTTKAINTTKIRRVAMWEHALRWGVGNPAGSGGWFKVFHSSFGDQLW